MPTHSLVHGWAVIDDIRKGRATQSEIIDLRVKEEVQFVPPAAVTVTNGQVVTLSGVINRLAASGGASGTTNVITLANVPVAGRMFTIINTSAQTNSLGINLGGSWKSASVTLASNEMVVVFAADTNALYGVE